jgi:hypothetical protein
MRWSEDLGLTGELVGARGRVTKTEVKVRESRSTSCGSASKVASRRPVGVWTSGPFRLRRTFPTWMV